MSNRHPTQVSKSSFVAFALLTATTFGVFANDGIVIQGSSTVSSRLFVPFKASIEEKSGQKIAVTSSKSSAGLIALLEGQAQIAMMSSPLEEEIPNVKKILPTGDFASLKAFEIGRTRAAFAIHPKNSTKPVSMAQLKDILTGQIGNWKEVGGPDMPIRLVVVRQGGGVLSTVEAQMNGGKDIDVPNMIKVNNGSQVIKVVQQEEGALGIAQLGLVSEAKLPELGTEKPIEQRLFLITKNTPAAPLQKVIEAAREVASRELR
ncbi:MAG: substrate-binding domain-containing protein [Rhizobiales bacterium]|nr:substrate-binding domain-containing protein [Hyphomicrobiales bacterium]